MASGLPVITTRHSGLPEQVTDGVNGLVVPEDNWRMLANAIVSLVEHPERWAPMGVAGRAHARESYDNRVLIDSQIALYHELA